jgi:hypothetical protein
MEKKKPKCEQWNVHYVKKMERMKEISNEKNGKNLNEKKKTKSMKKYLITLCMKFQTCFSPTKGDH